MDLGLQGRGVLVCGASRGLGRAAATALAAEGAHVVVAARSADGVAAVVEELGPPATGLVLDVGAPDLAAVDAALDALPGLDGLLLNGGGPPPGRALELSGEQWADAFGALVAGPLRLLRHVRPRLREGASVLWMTSSSVREPIPGLDASNLLRPGIAALVGSLARDLAPGVRVNAIAPGRIDTDRLRELGAARAAAAGHDEAEQRARSAAEVPLGRHGEPAELGRVAAFLLSPAASYVTGTTVQVDGGLVRAVP